MLETTKLPTNHFLHCGSQLEVVLYIYHMIKVFIRNLVSCLEKYTHLTPLKLNYVYHGDTSHIIKNIARYDLFSLLILLLGLWNPDKASCFAANKNCSKDQSKITVSLVPN